MCNKYFSVATAFVCYCCIVMQNIQIPYVGPVMLSVTCPLYLIPFLGFDQ